MRVIAGRFRGRRLAAPRGRGTRPTADRVREAIFSILGDLDGLAVLDLFAGTGALGIEALSRGATSAVFVERDPDALAALRANLVALGLQAPGGEAEGRPAAAGAKRPAAVKEARPMAAATGGLTPAAAEEGRSARPPADEGLPHVEVRAQDALTALSRAAVAGEAYDLVFLDPPYSQAASLTRTLAQALPPALAKGARVVVESDRRAPLALGLGIERERRYGDTSITIHRHDER